MLPHKPRAALAALMTTLIIIVGVVSLFADKSQTG